MILRDVKKCLPVTILNSLEQIPNNQTRVEVKEAVFLGLNSKDQYGTSGCCLTCRKQADGCLCFNCKCRKCDWYEIRIHGWDLDLYDYKDYKKCQWRVYVGNNF